MRGWVGVRRRGILRCKGFGNRAQRSCWRLWLQTAASVLEIMYVYMYIYVYIYRYIIYI